MGLFTSLDGVDSNGQRAEVNVQVGTGRVKDVVGRGNPNDDGVFRNVEVVFDPDNPLLKRKVYAMLDTTAKELFDYVTAAQADGRTVAYRIESQRKRGVDRSIPFADLKHSEDVVRILAAVDQSFSHEAKTDPLEDPDQGRGENPSALAQRTSGAAPAAAAASTAVAAADLVVVWEVARDAGVPSDVLNVVAAQALTAGADPTLFVPDRYSSAAVAAAEKAEQFALDHLVVFYSQPASAWAKQRDVEVVDIIFAQAAGLGVELLALADDVQVAAVGEDSPNREASSYQLALRLVCDSVDKRHAFPLGETGESIAQWRESVAEEAVERMRGVNLIADGVVPGSVLNGDASLLGQVDSGGAGEGEAEAEVVAVEKVKVAPPSKKRAAGKKRAAKSGGGDGGRQPAAADVAPSVGESAVETVAETFQAEIVTPKFGEPGYLDPPKHLIDQLKDVCVRAGVMDNVDPIVRWLIAEVGAPRASEVHAPVLEKFVAECEQLPPEMLAEKILAHA